MTAIRLTKDSMSCSICMDHLLNPVTIPCGHFFCEECIETHWNNEEKKKKKSCSCPQCRKTFTQRPDPVKSSLLADLVMVLKKTRHQDPPAEQPKKTGHQNAPASTEQSKKTRHQDPPAEQPKKTRHQDALASTEQPKKTKLHDAPASAEQPKKTKLQAAPASAEQPKKTKLQDAPAGPEDVACDVCSGRKQKALKSCLSCLVSYCETHLQPHYESPAFKKHKLVEPCKTLQENLCPRHDEVMKMFCRTDQQLICYLCSVDEHKGHNTVSAAAEREKKQQELDEQQKVIQQRIQDRKKDLIQLQLGEVAISRSVDQAVEDNQAALAELVRFLLDGNSNGKQRIRYQQEAEESRNKDLQEKLKLETAELKKRDAELKKLSQTENHIEFLCSFPSLSELSKSTLSSCTQIRPTTYFKERQADVTNMENLLEDVLTGGWKNKLQREIEAVTPEIDTEVDGSEPKSRAGFLKLSCDLTLDRNTANELVVLFQGNRRATATKHPKTYPEHSERFMTRPQVLSKDSLPELCYFEVDCGKGGVNVAVSYKSIKRYGQLNRSTFGCNIKSWMLDFGTDSCVFKHKGVYTNIAYPQSSRVGVYLDQKAGLLSFYSVSETMTLLHRVQTTFTEPLYAGLGLYGNGNTADIR